MQVSKDCTKILCNSPKPCCCQHLCQLWISWEVICFLPMLFVHSFSRREMAAQPGTKSQSRALPQRFGPVAGVVCLWSNFFLILCFRVNNILLGCWSGWIQKALCSGPCCLWPKEVIIHIMFRGTYTEAGLRCHPVWFYWLYLSCSDLTGLW